MFRRSQKVSRSSVDIMLKATNLGPRKALDGSKVDPLVRGGGGKEELRFQANLL